MSIQTVNGLIGDWASPIRRAQLQQSIERIRSEGEQKVENTFNRSTSSFTDRTDGMNEYEDVVGCCTPRNTPRGKDKYSDAAASAGNSTVPSNQITPEKLLRERKIAQDTYRREHGVAPKLPSFQDAIATKYYETRLG